MPKQLHPRKGFSPFRELVGAEFAWVEDGRSRCVLEVTEKLMNPNGTVHAGATFTLADTGMGVALWSAIGEDEACATIESQIVLLKPVRSGTLTCDTRLVHKSKRVATLESEITQNGELVAKALGTWSIFKRRTDQSASNPTGGR
jgi:acyl-CoA thioesterase